MVRFSWRASAVIAANSSRFTGFTPQMLNDHRQIREEAKHLIELGALQNVRPLKTLTARPSSLECASAPAGPRLGRENQPASGSRRCPARPTPDGTAVVFVVDDHGRAKTAGLASIASTMYRLSALLPMYWINTA